MRLYLHLFAIFAAALIASGSSAQTVVYTTSEYPVAEIQPDIPVQLLENIQELEQALFPTLSDNPKQAEAQARLRMQQPDWREQEARLTRAYQALMDAQTVGITHIPAVVFDGQYVVYGTTDVELATQKLDAWRELSR